MGPGGPPGQVEDAGTREELRSVAQERAQGSLQDSRPIKKTREGSQAGPGLGWGKHTGPLGSGAGSSHLLEKSGGIVPGRVRVRVISWCSFMLLQTLFGTLYARISLKSSKKGMGMPSILAIHLGEVK